VPDPRNRRYWETSALIALIANEDGRGEDCRLLMKEAESGVYIAVTAAVSIPECTRERGRPPRYRQRDTIDAFFERDFFEVIPVERFLSVEAKTLVWKYGLTPYDAVHLAAAIHAKCGMFYTYDADLLKLDGRIDGMGICRPVWEGQMTLPVITTD